jgi:hypothetical protein
MTHGQKYTNKLSAKKPEGNTALWRRKRRWKHNIQMDVKEIVWEDADWINPVQNRDW